MIDSLAAFDDRVDWITKHGTNGTSPLPQEKLKQYLFARRYMQYAPVLRKCRNTGKVIVVPLNDLPAGTPEWVEYFGSDFGLGSLINDEEYLSKIYHCDVLPLERKPLSHYSRWIRFEGTDPPPLFHELNFLVHPIQIQPKLCLVNWLRARGLNARLMNLRAKIVNLVHKCL